MDPYKTLGVQRNADAKDIKMRYRTLARKHHPDRGGNAETFKQINEAYQLLNDTRERTQSDESFRPQEFSVNRPPPVFAKHTVATTIEINGFTKTVTTIETKNGVVTKNVKTSSLFEF